VPQLWREAGVPWVLALTIADALDPPAREIGFSSMRS
jgi:hypothetical protein